MCWRHEKVKIKKRDRLYGEKMGGVGERRAVFLQKAYPGMEFRPGPSQSGRL